MIDPIYYLWISLSFLFCALCLIFHCKPRLDFWLDIGILRISTELMNHSYHNNQTRYIAVSIFIFQKWGFQFNLYNPRH